MVLGGMRYSLLVSLLFSHAVFANFEIDGVWILNLDESLARSSNERAVDYFPNMRVEFHDGTMIVANPVREREASWSISITPISKTEFELHAYSNEVQMLLALQIVGELLCMTPTEIAHQAAPLQRSEPNWLCYDRIQTQN
jgi:hypothetical protein